MVSTRGVRYKFNEGERVLCYEPDPTKAKVLYDSKVLEVIESKDKRGRRTVEYLIHFQGWNSSWDRCVSEDFVLKDTEENRQLQRDLAEKSQLQLGAYLYRRERKKVPSNNTGAGPAKRPRHGFSDDGSSTSTHPDDAEVEAADTDSSTGSHASSQASPPNNNVHVGRAHITLPSALSYQEQMRVEEVTLAFDQYSKAFQSASDHGLWNQVEKSSHNKKDRLTFDYHLVVKRGRLSRLPASPCAALILESFVKWFARAGAWHPARGRHEPPVKPDLLDVSRRLNLVREVADGLRVYFDFILRGHLLYKQELDQYHEFCGKFVDESEQEEEERASELEDEESQSLDEANTASAEEDLKSPKIPEYSHLPPDPVDEDKIEESLTDPDEPEQEQELEEIKTEMEIDENDISKSVSPVEDNTNHTEDPGKSREETTTTENVNVARRLRSHKSAVSQSENEEPAPSTSGEPRTFETLSSSVGSSGSSMSDGWCRPVNSAPAAPTPTRTPLSLLLDKVAKWQIIPRDGTENLPCRVYGAIHLARLFVKLPDFLNASQMPDYKLKLILKHIDMFVQYLDEHSEWFGEMYYVADIMSRSH